MGRCFYEGERMPQNRGDAEEETRKSREARKEQEGRGKSENR